MLQYSKINFIYSIQKFDLPGDMGKLRCGLYIFTNCFLKGGCVLPGKITT